jgi:hypothetical protein
MPRLERLASLLNRQIRRPFGNNTEAYRPIDYGSQSRFEICAIRQLAELDDCVTLDGFSPNDNGSETRPQHFAMILLQKESGVPSIPLLKSA